MFATHFDGFYPDPTRVRSIALAGDWAPVTGEFTGLEYRCAQFPMPLVIERVATLTGLAMRYNRRRPAVFRSLTSEQYQRKSKHVHVDRMGIACVICLSEPSGPDPYTSFYRHRRTGLRGVGDRTAIVAAAIRARTSPKSLLQQLDRDGGDLSRWERVAEIPYRFNRLVAFDSNLFHVAGSGTGDDVGSAKLTQNFNAWSQRRWRFDQRLTLGPAILPVKLH